MKKEKNNLTKILITVLLIVLILFIWFFIKNSIHKTSKWWVITERPVIDFSSLSQEDE